MASARRKPKRGPMLKSAAAKTQPALRQSRLSLQQKTEKRALEAQNSAKRIFLRKSLTKAAPRGIIPPI